MPIAIGDEEILNLKMGSERIGVRFRRPNAKEMIRYLCQSLSGQGQESVGKMLEAGIELASTCILGVNEGDIILIEKGARNPLVSDPGKTGYLPNWKELLHDKFPSLLLTLGNHIVKLARLELEVREKNLPGNSD